MVSYGTGCSGIHPAAQAVLEEIAVILLPQLLKCLHHRRMALTFIHILSSIENFLEYDHFLHSVVLGIESGVSWMLGKWSNYVLILEYNS